MVTQHYRWDFIGLSTDDKPTPATSEKVTDGSTFYCSDNSKLYVWYKDQWYEKEDTGGGGELPIASADTLGGIKVGTGLSINSESGVLSADGVITELTTADYNNSEENPTHIQLWKLPAGFYKWASGVVVQPINQAWSRRMTYGGMMWRGLPSNFTQSFIVLGLANEFFEGVVNVGDGTFQHYLNSDMSPVIRANIRDNLTATSSNEGVLDAHQGYVLKGLIDAKGNTLSDSAPTTSTVGVLGQLYTDTTNMHTYQCTAIDGNTYTWTQRW